MRTILEFINKGHIKETKPRNVFYTEEIGYTAMEIESIEDLSYCYKINNQRCRKDFYNNVYNMLRSDKIVLLYFYKNGDIDFYVLEDEDDLHDNWDFVCNINLDEFTNEKMMYILQQYIY